MTTSTLAQVMSRLEDKVYEPEYDRFVIDNESHVIEAPPAPWS